MLAAAQYACDHEVGDVCARDDEDDDGDAAHPEERARLEAGARPEGGFRLQLTVPLAAA